MVIFTAIIAKRSTCDLTSFQQRLTTVISRDPNQPRCVFHSSDSVFCYCDGSAGAFGASPFIENEQHWLLCSGHPLLSDSFEDDLVACLNREALETLLLEAQGTFTLIKYDKTHQAFLFYCDPLAIRPFYVYENDDVIILASSLRILEGLNLRLSVDQDAVMETVMLGYPLGDKTRYLEIKTAKPAEKRIVSSKKNHTDRYFCWADQAYEFSFDVEALHGFQRKFFSVMRHYQAGDSKTISTLSGGLDSRLVNVDLMSNGCVPYCFNFSREETQDLSFAKQFAASHRIPFFVEQVEDTQAMSVEQQLGRIWRHADRPEKTSVARPNLCWSGNGGSVCLGQVYFTNAIYEACQTGVVENVVMAFLDSQMAYISTSVVKQAPQWQANLKQSLIDCLNCYPHLPLEKRFQLFLWENDQHRHCALAAEAADLFQLDFCHPFYAKGMLDSIWRLPIKILRNHHFYAMWMNKYYAQSLNVPWQTYPEHEVCPLSFSWRRGESLPQSQWAVCLSKQRKKALVKSIWEHLKRGKDGRYCFSALVVQTILTQWGIRDYSANLNLVIKIDSEWPKIKNAHHMDGRKLD